MSRLRTMLAAATRPKGPTGQQQSSIIPELSGQGAGLPGWSHFVPQDRELADAWRGKQRTETVEDMLNDTQVTALRQAIRLPAHRYHIELAPMDADPIVAELLAADLDIPVQGGPDELRPRRADRFSSRRHLDRALDALDYGHAVFEHAGRIDDAGYWRLADLPPVPQWTIDDSNSWEVDRQGRVIRVIQWGGNPPVKLDVDRLAIFTWQGRAGDPRGRPILRSLYRAYVGRDRTLRVMGMSAERTGMGLPIGRTSPSAGPQAKADMERLLAGLAAGNETNIVVESDEDIRTQLMLMGVTGSTPDLVGMLRYHDESMARATLAMLLQLGQTETGSRALGGTFDDLLGDFHDTVVDWYCDVMSEQVVRAWVDRNRGVDAPAPRLVWSRREDDEAAADDVDEQEAAIDSTAVEEPQQLPAPVAARRPSQLQSPSQLQLQLARRQRATRTAFASLTGRELRRDPSETELAAAADFATIEAQFTNTRASVSLVLLAARDELAAAAVEEVAAMDQVDPLTLADTLAPLLEQHAEDMDAGGLVALLVAFAAAGVGQVIGEAARQGVPLEASVDYSERASADAADLLRRMARQVAESAASAARTAVPAGVAGQPAANIIGEHLGSLTAAQPEAAAAGAVSRAQNAGRAAAMAEGPVASVVCSEILDQATCPPCALKDGEEYSSLESALEDYPAGGYLRCEGMERCRGLLLALFDESVA